MSDKEKKDEKKSCFWLVYNQEEQVVAMSWAKTPSGALARFEEASGHTRDGYRAEEVSFDDGCVLMNVMQ